MDSFKKTEFHTLTRGFSCEKGVVGTGVIWIRAKEEELPNR